MHMYGVNSTVQGPIKDIIYVTSLVLYIDRVSVSTMQCLLYSGVHMG